MLLHVVQLLRPREAHLFFERIFGVRAAVHHDLARFQLRNFVDDVIEQIPIVRDDDDRAVIVVDGAFQKRLAVEIEMVIRFVEQQQGWAA